jgi:hypothetical protein
MPPSSPGMDMPTKEKYTVYAFDAQGKKSVYAVRQ